MKVNLTSKLKHKIIVQSKTEIPDGAGGFTVNWIDALIAFADIQYDNLREYVLGGKKISEKIIKITTRYNPNINTSHRIKFNDSVFQIKTIDNISYKNEILEITCNQII